MSETGKMPRVTVQVDLWLVCMVVLILAFAGDPDLMTAIIYRLMETP